MRAAVRFYRQNPADADPHELLKPGNQYSTPWGEPDRGPCDKCCGDRTCMYRCLSCIEQGSDLECPACQGRVEFQDRCPACGGTGEITDTKRNGVSVFPSLAGLYRYLVERDFDFEGSVIVELEGEPGEEPDLDAEAGALLAHPAEVVRTMPVDRERVSDLRRRLGRREAPGRPAPR